MTDDARNRLRDTIKALERASDVPTEPTAPTQSSLQDQLNGTIPWDLAQHVAVQREASRMPPVLGPSSGSLTGTRKGKRTHPGPSSMMKARTNTNAFTGAGKEFGGTEIDPFNRTAPVINNPNEANWRAVAGTVSGAKTVPPLGAAASGGASMDVDQLHLLLGGGETFSKSGPAAHKRGAGGSSSIGPKGWCANPMQLPEVPEQFWLTVAPDVHHEITEHLFNQDYNQGEYLHAIVDLIKSKRSQPWGKLPTVKRSVLQPAEVNDLKTSVITNTTRVAETGGYLTADNRSVGAKAMSRWFLPDGNWEWHPCHVIDAAEDGVTYMIKWVESGGVKTISRFNILFQGETEEALDDLIDASRIHQRRIMGIIGHGKLTEAIQEEDLAHLPQAAKLSILARVGGREPAQMSSRSLPGSPGRMPLAAPSRLHSLGAQGGGDQQSSGGSGGGGRRESDDPTSEQSDMDSRSPEETPQVDPSKTSHALSQAASPGRVRVRSPSKTTGCGGGGHASASSFPVMETFLKLNHQAQQRFGGTAKLRSRPTAFGDTTTPSGATTTTPLQSLLRGTDQSPSLLRTSLPELGEARSHPSSDNVFLGWKQDAANQWNRFLFQQPSVYLEGILAEAAVDYVRVHKKLAYRAQFERETGVALSTNAETAVMDLMSDPHDEKFTRQVKASFQTSNTDDMSRLPTPKDSPFPEPPPSVLPTFEASFYEGPEATDATSSGYQNYPTNDADLATQASLPELPSGFLPLLSHVSHNVLIADPHLLDAWRQVHHYMLDICSRDMFGLNELPLRGIYRTASPMSESARLIMYLKSRRRLGDHATLNPQEPLAETVHLVTLLNVQEGVRESELEDLHFRIIKHLANILMDTAEANFANSLEMYNKAPPQQHLLLKYGAFGVNDGSSVRQARPFNIDNLVRLAGLTNVMLHNTLCSWLAQNLANYATGLRLYTSPSYKGTALIEVQLNAVGADIKFSPSLDLVGVRLVENILEVARGVNSIRGLSVIPSAPKDIKPPANNPPPGSPNRIAPQLHHMPFRVLPDLQMPMVLTDESPALESALRAVQEVVADGVARCDALIRSFAKYLPLLKSEPLIVRQQIDKDRATMTREDWRVLIQKYRAQESQIIEDLPIGVNLGIFHVDCRSIRLRLVESVQKLAATCLIALEEDALDAADRILHKLRVVYDVLTMKLVDMQSLQNVRGMLVVTSAAIEAHTDDLAQIRTSMTILEDVKFSVEDEVISHWWSALRLPVQVKEQVLMLHENLDNEEQRLIQELSAAREDLLQEIEALEVEMDSWKTVKDEEQAEHYVEIAGEQSELIRDMMKRSEAINKMEPLAGMDQTSFSKILKLKTQLSPFNDLWVMVKLFKESFQCWMYGPLYSFNMTDLETSLPAWTKTAMQLSRDMKGNSKGVAQKYLRLLVEFEGHVPLVRAMRTHGLRQRHWDKIHERVPEVAAIDRSQLSLHLMVQAGMYRHADFLQEVSNLAARELVVEHAIDQVESDWNTNTLRLRDETESGFEDMLVLTNGNELLQFVDDALICIKSLSSSVFVEPHKGRVVGMDGCLKAVRDVLEKWADVQSIWVQLAPMFGPKGHGDQLLIELRRFKAITEEWRMVVHVAYESGTLNELLRHADLLSFLKRFHRALEGVHKAVMEFFEEKRSIFPRFYFLSNTEMVDLLCLAHNPVSVESYLGRCFQGIHKVVITREWGVRIEGLLSGEGEKLPLTNPVDLMDYNKNKARPLEYWFTDVERQMRVSMRETMRKCLESMDTISLQKWIFAWPAQSMLLSSAIMWCKQITDALKRGPPLSSRLMAVERSLKQQVMTVVDVIKSTKLSALNHTSIENLIIAKVYHQEVTQRLRLKRVTEAEDIEWLSVMRFYVEGETVMRCGYARLPYGLEYLGSTHRLVITPLTERAFSSLITAIQLHYGGAPEGPAGTGKTETVKEMARGMGKACIVFNTTESLDITHMSRLLMGISSTGAWSCFDEFDRMDIQVLSVVSKQILTIQSALAAGLRNFMLDGRNLSLSPTLAMFITMNPMYVTRNVLPSNLKALFRPVAMMVPNYRIIAEVSLYSNGYSTAAHLARCLVSCLKIANERLSPASHYDFQMRALKGVLLVAARLREDLAGTGDMSCEEEAKICRVALLRCNLSKLKASDTKVFMDIVDREFPHMAGEDEYQSALKEKVISAASLIGLVPSTELVVRCLQMHSLMQFRTGIMLLGPAACGKTSIIRALSAALQLPDADGRQATVISYNIFPKSAITEHLFGVYNETSREWEDGTITSALRAASSPTHPGLGWLTLDGPVDPVWVEMLNPVLDDNKALCLSSGETMPVRDGVNVILEVDSIASASPATISRCGVVFMEKPQDLWHFIINNWANQITGALEDWATKMESTLTQVFGELIRAYSDLLEPDPYCPRQQPTSIVLGVLRLLDSLLARLALKMSYGLDLKATTTCIESSMLFSLIWGFHASLPAKANAFFNILVRQMCARTVKYIVKKDGVPAEVSSLGFVIPMPAEGTVFDYMFNFDDLSWVTWRDHLDLLLDVQRLPKGPEAFIPFGLGNLVNGSNPAVMDFVFTADNLPAIYTLRLLMQNKSSAVLVGPTGTGKSALAQAILASADEWMLSDQESMDQYSLQTQKEAAAAARAIAAASRLAAQSFAEHSDAGEPKSPTRSLDTLSSVIGMVNGEEGRDEKARKATENEQLLRALLKQASRQLHEGSQEGSVPAGGGRLSKSFMGEAKRQNPIETSYISLSAQSTASNLKEIIGTFLQKRGRCVIGPSVGKVAVLLVDDLNVAGRDDFGTQSAIELLRQWFTQGGWHDESASRFRELVDTHMLACMTVSSYQKTISDRILQHVNLVTMPSISQAGFQLIFTTMLHSYLSASTTIPHDLLSKMVSATMELYKQVTGFLLPVPSRPHYLFSIRHVCQVFRCMFHASRASRSTPRHLVMLWQHECGRIFHDRILDPPTREWFVRQLSTISHAHLDKYCPEAMPCMEDVTFCSFAAHGCKSYELAEYVLRTDRPPSARLIFSRRETESQVQLGLPAGSTPSPHPNTLDGGLEGAGEPNASELDIKRCNSVKLPDGMPDPSPKGRTLKHTNFADSPPTTASDQDGEISASSGKKKGKKPKAQGKSRGLRRVKSAASAEAMANQDGEGSPMTPTRKKLVASKSSTKLRSSTHSLNSHHSGDESQGALDQPLLPGSPDASDMMMNEETALYEMYNKGWEDNGEPKDIVTQQRLINICELHAKEFSSNSSVSHGASLVIFKQALIHLARICRVLSMSSGHMILMGPPGSGRRSLSRLASHVSKVRLYETRLKDKQTGYNWHEELKTILHMAGVLGRSTMLLLTDSNHSADNQLDDLNLLLSMSFIPGLFKAHEMANIVSSLKPVARQSGIVWSENDLSGSADHLLQQFFINRIKANLHIVMVFEFQEQAIQAKVIRFPKMFHLATLNMVDRWNKDACGDLARRKLISPETLQVDNLVFHEVVSMSMEMHFDVKRMSEEYILKSGGSFHSPLTVTGMHYLSFLDIIKAQLPRMRNLLSTDVGKYREGVAKMGELTHNLGLLKDEIAAMHPKLHERQAETGALMCLIKEEKAEVENMLTISIPEEQSADLAAAETAALVAACESDLDVALPPLQSALDGLQSIQKSSIAELKSMKKPPAGVKLVMRCILIMLEVIPQAVLDDKLRSEDDVVQAWWTESVKVLSDFHFLDRLLCYDKDRMSVEMSVQIEAFASNPLFDPDIVRRTSASAAALANWIRALSMYQIVKKDVDPKRAALKTAEKTLAQRQKRLKQLRNKLDKTRSHIVALEQRYIDAVAAKDKLQDEMELAQQKVSQAQRVLTVVRKEVDRWALNAEIQQARHKQVLGEALLASGYIAYLGPMPGSLRTQIELTWSVLLENHDHAAAPNFRLSSCIGESPVLDLWASCHLPQSRTAIENALIMHHSVMWCLMLDPQELGCSFIKEYYTNGHTYTTSKQNKLLDPSYVHVPAPLKPFQEFVSIHSQNTSKYEEKLISAVESGSILLLENVADEMDDVIEQLFLKNLVLNARGQVCMKLGLAVVLLHPDFRLYAAVQSKTPLLPFELLCHVCITNFSITNVQLTELLVTMTLKHEMPYLEQEHASFVKQKARSENEIMALEEATLAAINKTKIEELVEISEVYNMLISLQESSSNLKLKFSRIRDNEEHIMEVRRGIEADFVGKVVPFFFILQELSSLQHVYQFSLKWFLALFQNLLFTCVRSNMGKERLYSLSSNFVSLFYTIVSRSLFECDKMPVAIIMLCRFLVASNIASKEETGLLLVGRSNDGGIARPTVNLPAESKRSTNANGGRSSSYTGGQKGASTHEIASMPPLLTTIGDDNGEEEAFAKMFQKSGSRTPTPPPDADPTSLQATQDATPSAAGGADPTSHHAMQEAAPSASGAGSEARVVGGTIHELLELNAPAYLKDDLRPPWLPEEAWLRLKDLGKLAPFNKLLPRVFENVSGPWLNRLHRYYEGLAMEGVSAAKPSNGIDKLNAFQLLLFIRCFQPHAFVSAAQAAIRQYLGPACTAMDPPDLEQVLHDSVAEIPIACISAINPPLAQISQFAEANMVPLLHMAVGRGQGFAVQKLIKSSANQPFWVVLENAHLAGEWMPLLCSLIQELPSLDPHPKFRLWLTMVPASDLPIEILQTAVKLVLDPPGGIKSYVLQALDQLPAEVAMSGKMAKRHGMTALIEAEAEAAAVLAKQKSVKEREVEMMAEAAVRKQVEEDAKSQSRVRTPKKSPKESFSKLDLGVHKHIAREDKDSGFGSDGVFLQGTYARKSQSNNVTGGQEVEDSIDDIINDVIPDCIKKPDISPKWKQLIIRVCIFHAVLIERMNYRGLAWRQHYEFTASDCLAAVKEILQIRNMVGTSDEDIDKALPGMMFTNGQCLYGGKVTHDWDRRMIMCHLSTQLTGVCAGKHTTASDMKNSVATLDTLFPEKVRSCKVDLIQTAKDIRYLLIDKTDPTLVGLTPGAAAVQQNLKTASMLSTLKRLQITQHSEDSSDGSRVLQVALGVAQEVSRQLPFYPLPTVKSGWVAMINEKSEVSTGVSPPSGPGGPNAQPAPPPPPAPAKAPPKVINRSRQIKMFETFAPEALARWRQLDEYVQNTMIQIFEGEVNGYQALLSTVHSTVKTVTSAIKGFEPVNEQFNGILKKLSCNEVPLAWLNHPQDLNSQTMSTWIKGVMERLNFIYDWAVDGPPVFMPLGILTRPRAFLTSLLQIHAEKHGLAVGSLAFECYLMKEFPADLDAYKVTPEQMTEKKMRTVTGPSGSTTISMKEAQDAGCLISNVMLQGAKWDSKHEQLVECDNHQIFDTMPLLWIKPVTVPDENITDSAVDQPAAQEVNHSRNAVAGGLTSNSGDAPLRGSWSESSDASSGLYVCPVYKQGYSFGMRYSDVEDCLFTVLLPCGKHNAEHWAMRNVVMLACANTDELLSMQHSTFAG